MYHRIILDFLLGSYIWRYDPPSRIQVLTFYLLSFKSNSELGAHIDGYMATNGHTTVINANPAAPIEGRAADVVCAAHFAAEAALRLMKIGNNNIQVQEAIAEAAALFNCSPVTGTASNEVKRYVIATEKMIMNVPDEENRPVQDFVFVANEAYTLNILISSGDGTCREGAMKPTVFSRNVHQNYNLKLKSARAAFNEISNDFGVFPFSIRYAFFPILFRNSGVFMFFVVPERLI